MNPWVLFVFGVIVGVCLGGLAFAFLVVCGEAARHRGDD